MTKVHQFFGGNNKYIYINGEELKRILLLSFGISQGKSVKMSVVNEEIELKESGKSTEEGQYKWLLRGFTTGNIENLQKQVFVWLLGVFYRGERRIRILIDRTNWEIGERDINILSIGMLSEYGGYIPLLHEDLGYKGNSDGETRLNLIKKLLEWWKVLDIKLPVIEIVGDREFIGEEWLMGLEELGVKYIIRLRSNLKFYEWGEEKMSYAKYCIKDIIANKQKKGEYTAQIVLDDRFIANVVSVKYQGNKSEKEPFLYLITNLDDINDVGETYRKRWKIETCFKHLKSLGYNLEGFALQGAHKTDILMAILSLVYALAIFCAKKVKPIPKNKNKPQFYKKNNKEYPRISTFCHGAKVLAKMRTFREFSNVCYKFFDNAHCNLNILSFLHIKPF